jgi:hypothetical protein
MIQRSAESGLPARPCRKKRRVDLFGLSTPQVIRKGRCSTGAFPLRSVPFAASHQVASGAAPAGVDAAAAGQQVVTPAAAQNVRAALAS